MIRAVQAPIPPVPPEPSWLGNAQAGLIVAAILGLGYAWQNRRRARGKLAFIAGLASIALVIYFSFFRGYAISLPSLPGFVVRPVPAWKPFLIGFIIPCALIGACFLALAKATPSRATPTEQWAGLNEDDRTVLTKMWASEGMYLQRHERAEFERQWGHARWNTLRHSLETKGLVRWDWHGDYSLSDSARHMLAEVVGAQR
jgi:hypothetical protein